VPRQQTCAENSAATWRMQLTQYSSRVLQMIRIRIQHSTTLDQSYEPNRHRNL